VSRRKIIDLTDKLLLHYVDFQHDDSRCEGKVAAFYKLVEAGVTIHAAHLREAEI
jgi:hypothetical protein